MKVKLEDYRRMGIQTIVVIDPEKEPATLSRYFDGKLETITEPVMELPKNLCSIDWRRVREFWTDVGLRKAGERGVPWRLRFTFLLQSI